MGFEIDISELMTAAGNTRQFLNNTQNKVLIKATKRALVRTTPTGVKAILVEFMKERKVKASVLRQYIVVQKNLKGKGLEQLNVTFGIKKKSFGLIHFVKGSKTPRSQAGRPVMARRALKVEIKPGKVEIRPQAFIAKGRGGAYQVFQRKSKSSLPIAKQTEPGLPALLAKKEVHEPILNQMSVRFVDEMAKAITWSFSQEQRTFDRK